MSQSKASLLIGIGNRLRGDDGAGYRLAEALSLDPPKSVQVIATQQLTMELSATLAASQRVLFVDATLDPERCCRWSAPCLEAMDVTALQAVGLSHQLTPEALLAATDALYHCAPKAWQLLLPGLNWGHGDALSPLTEAAVSASLPLVRAWSRAHA